MINPGKYQQERKLLLIQKFPFLADPSGLTFSLFGNTWEDFFALQAEGRRFDPVNSHKASFNDEAFVLNSGHNASILIGFHGILPRDFGGKRTDFGMV